MAWAVEDWSVWVSSSSAYIYISVYAYAFLQEAVKAKDFVVSLKYGDSQGLGFRSLGGSAETLTRTLVQLALLPLGAPASTA